MHKTKKLDSSWASFCDKAICKVAEHDSQSPKDDEQNDMIPYPENNLNQ